jgi:hypothetical protein
MCGRCVAFTYSKPRHEMGWIVSVRLRPLYPMRNSPRYPLNRTWFPNHGSMLRKSKRKGISLFTRKSAATHTAVTACRISVVAKFFFSPIFLLVGKPWVVRWKSCNMQGRELEDYGIARMGRGVDTNSRFESGGEVCLRLEIILLRIWEM